MSKVFDFINAAYAQDGSSPQKHVLLVLAIAVNEHGVCWLKQETISARTGLSRRTVIDAIQHWVTVGVLDIDNKYAVHPKHGSRRIANVYTLTLPEGANVQEPHIGLCAPPAHRISAGDAQQELPSQELPVQPQEKAFSLPLTPTPSRRGWGSGRGVSRRSKPEYDDMADPADKVRDLFKADDTESHPLPARPRTKTALTGYWITKVMLRRSRAGSQEEARKLLTPHFAHLLSRGLSPAALQEMIDLFDADPGLREKSPHPWKTFIGASADLQMRVEQGADDDVAVAESYGSLPAHLRDI